MPTAENREHWIVHEARKRPFAERSAFLDGACGEDPALRRRIEALLAAPGPGLTASATDSDADHPTIKLTLADAPDEALGQMLGRYKVLQKIGEGGCGAVYMAEQEQPVRRRVALKVIKLGMDTKAVIARFEAERQALALMDHPNIAKVLDAGSTEAGRPYFVMELVRGIKFTEYCDQNHLGIRQRLELFVQVCQAIQHAHQKGIIHRDIKPSNILVTLHDGVPVPKVIDFGIAKATTDQRLTDKTLFTAYEQFIGTPAYMSPEQAEMSGLDVDTRSDIYSLGVLLYELLTSKTPFDPKELMESGLEAMRKTIREKDPVRPSTKLNTLAGDELTTTATRHGVDAPKLASQLRGDLDWIVMKCLEKDRTRRYETANGLAMDIKRHLSNETVIARPPSKVYEFQRTFRRHKLGFIATGSVILALTVGVALTAWQAVVATRAKREEAIQRQRAEANEQKAVAAQARETKLREQAQAAELTARQRAYASDMNVAMEAVTDSNLGRAWDLLNRQRPEPGQKDLRGWEWRYAWEQTRSDALFTLCQQSSEIFSLAASPDGKWLAVGPRSKGGLSVWDLQTHQELFRLSADEVGFQAAFSPTEPLLAFTSEAYLSPAQQPNTLRLCNPVTGQVTAQFPLEGKGFGLAFSLDGKMLATYSVSGNASHITLWRMPEGVKLADYPARYSSRPLAAHSFATTPDLRLAAYSSSVGSQTRVFVLDLHNGKELWTAPAANHYVTALAFSPDGQMLANGTGYDESSIRLWNVATGKEMGRLEGHQSWVSALVFLDGGKRLASSSADQSIRVWDVASRHGLDTLRGHRQEVWRLLLLPDQKTLVSGAKDGTVCFWDRSVLHPHQTRVKIGERVVNWGFAEDGRSVWTLNNSGEVEKWSDSGEAKPGGLRVVYNTGSLPTQRSSLYLFSADGRWLAAGLTNGVLSIWDLAQGRLAHQWTNTVGQVIPEMFSRDATKLFSHSDADDSEQEWDLLTGRQIQVWRAPVDAYTAAISPDERFHLSISYAGEAAVLRDLNKQTSSNPDVLLPESEASSYSPDAKLFAAASDLGIVPVWETAGWKRVTTLGGFLNGTHSVAFSSDGRRLVISSDLKEAVRLYDTDGWQNVFTLEAPGTGYLGAGFSPDNNNLVWGNQNSLYLWHAPSWAEIQAAEAKDKTEAQLR